MIKEMSQTLVFNLIYGIKTFPNVILTQHQDFLNVYYCDCDHMITFVYNIRKHNEIAITI